MSASHLSERSVALHAVARACRLCELIRAELSETSAMDKEDNSPVTVADFAAQALIGYELQAAFPDDPLVGEEDAQALKQVENGALKQKVVEYLAQFAPNIGEEAWLAAIDRGNYTGGAGKRFWTLDPIDGTKGFLRGDQYAVALALIEDGQPILGVLGCPNLELDGKRGWLFLASKGKGTIRAPLIEIANEQPVQVSTLSDIAQAVFCESVESRHSSQSRSARLAEALKVIAAPLRMDSQCKYAAVACGLANVYLRLPTKAVYEEKIWDHAAGWIVVHEAGGRVSDIDGRPLDFSLGRTLRNNRGIVATDGRLHEAIIAGIKTQE